MRPGDLYWADVPFAGGKESKLRPVLILRELDPNTAIVIRSTSKYKEHLSLLAAVNFDDPKYSGLPIKGVSYFYLVGLRTLAVDRLKSYVGPLPLDDFTTIVTKLKGLAK